MTLGTIGKLGIFYTTFQMEEFGRKCLEWLWKPGSPYNVI